MDEQNHDKKNQSNDPLWKELKDALNSEVPQDVENRLNKRLEAFKEELKAHPYIEKENQPGLPKWPQMSMRSPHLFRPFALAGTALICIVLGAYFLLGSSTPTWAEINQNLISYPYHAAIVYFKRHAFSETISFEFWVRHGTRMRILEGNRVTFAEKGMFVKTFDVDTRKETYTGAATLEILKRRGFLEHSDPHPSTPKIDAMMSGQLDENSIKVRKGVKFSEDVFIYESESNVGSVGMGRKKIQILAMRSSKLPLCITSFGEAGMRTEVIYSYFKEPSEAFFDSDVFEAKLKDSSNSAYSLLYMGLEEPDNNRIFKTEDRKKQ